MILMIFLITFITTWYLSMIIQTYVYLARYKIHLNILDVTTLPMILFKLYLNVVKEGKLGTKYLLLYFVNYKLSVIFLTELFLEDIAMSETVGFFSYIKTIVSLPETVNSFEKLLMVI